MKEKAPDVLDILSAMALPKVKAHGSQIPRVCTAYSLLMNTRYYKTLFQLYFSQANLNGIFVNLAVKTANTPNIQFERKSQFDLGHCFSNQSIPEWFVHWYYNQG